MSRLTLSISLLHCVFSIHLHADPLNSHFECRDQGNGQFRPFYLQVVGDQYKDWSKTPRGLLGQNAMTSSEECQRAVEVANQEFGAVCSRTGLDGWKPTTFTGTRPGRPDFGYLGGSSIVRFEDCLLATHFSSRKGVCFWGGSDWFVSPIDKEGLSAGPFRSVAECVQQTQE